MQRDVAMTRRERMLRTLRGEPVDRPAVNFYEINGMTQNPDDPNPFNVFNDPSWRPVLDLARDRTDRLVMTGMPVRNTAVDPFWRLSKVESEGDDTTRVTVRTVRIGNRELRNRTRRNADMNTTWTEEHFIKDVADLDAYLSLPEPELAIEPNLAALLDIEERLGDTGLAMISCGDPICAAAPLFDMSDYMVIAMTEPERFHRLLERLARPIWALTEAAAKAAPGRLWRICGPEYASPPYLPPALFREYVVRYTEPMVKAIQKHGGYARLHSHGRLRDILDDIAGMGCDGLDPIEPPNQGDVELWEVREKYGSQMVLFGNLEASDLVNLPAEDFEANVRQAVDEGTRGEGRGFVLQPSACPCGRTITPRILRNYEVMVELAEEYSR
jgi:uroporphyrinogen-III decarboxylase